MNVITEIKSYLVGRMGRLSADELRVIEEHEADLRFWDSDPHAHVMAWLDERVPF